MQSSIDLIQCSTAGSSHSLEEGHGLLLESVVEVVLGHGADVAVSILGGHLQWERRDERGRDGTGRGALGR